MRNYFKMTAGQGHKTMHFYFQITSMKMFQVQLNTGFVQPDSKALRFGRLVVSVSRDVLGHFTYSSNNFSGELSFKIQIIIHVVHL